MAIAKQTAMDLALAHFDLERAEALLLEIGQKMGEGTVPNVRDLFDRKTNGLGVAVLDGNSGSWQFFVEWGLARSIIEGHVAALKARLKALDDLAWRQLRDDQSGVGEH